MNYIGCFMVSDRKNASWHSPPTSLTRPEPKKVRFKVSNLFHIVGATHIVFI